MDHQGDGRRGLVTPRSSTALEKAAAVARGHQLVIDMYSACKHDSLITPRVHPCVADLGRVDGHPLYARDDRATLEALVESAAG